MATQKIAVAVVHGVGSQKPEFAKGFAERLRARFAADIGRRVPNPSEELQIRGVYWAKELADREQALEARFHLSGLRWGEARNIMIDLGGDALAYQLNRQASPEDPPGTYERIHMAFAGTLNALVSDADGEAPLCIVSHSLGTIIASNYMWDLQSDNVATAVRALMSETPLENGRTLLSFYTMGSPLAVWSLRFPDFGVPIAFPPTGLLERYRNAPAEWLNLYDQDDVIAYPLKVLNERYRASVTEDIPVSVGNVLTMWNPAAHTGYWMDSDTVGRCATGLASVWRSLNS
jgi:hypothetical protein